ncbi:replicative DNA helicase [candidate division KSB1 bacterium]|nr:replicative DNA helicase [candidate division KSB1 bacterium]NIR72262.1 replicative DNA helicase [candidate division KSB1 bacterium]NIS24233.1 replicative DNA helicase [candidate division KSB1 bacterium]NIT71147.1 replicative DNA helicase [candidate division KSB1 bacterium]NIU24852.1 replicative DNA helicase [candidate division KSB1 bacterium]
MNQKPNQEVSTERMPPQAIDAEMAVLGSMLISKEAVTKCIEILDPSAFYKTAHEKIFQATINLDERGSQVDYLTITDELEKMGELDEVGGAYYITELSNTVPSAANVEYYAKIVLEKSLLRKLIDVSNEIATDAYEARDDAVEIIDSAEQKIFTLSERKLRRGFLPIRPILQDTFEVIEGYHERQGTVTGVPTGFDQLDHLTSGFQNADLIIVAGRPSMGKTAFCLNVARNVAVIHKIPAGIFSLEMSSTQLAMRMLCTEAPVDAHKVRTGKLPEDDWQKLSRSVGRLDQAPIFIDDSAALSVLEIRAKARRLKAEHNIGLLIVDYLQLVKGPKSSESRQIEISMISQSLKALAKELGIPVVALSQLSRAVEARGGDRRPILSDLRESGAIEQDADVVMFIYRPEAYASKNNPVPPEYEGIAEIIVAKQRNGPTDTVRLAFQKDYVLFANLDYSHKEVYPADEPF